MQEKRYPIIEDEGDGEYQSSDYSCMIAAESAVAYATEQTFAHLKEYKSFDYSSDYDPGIGPYSLKEMNARIDKAERDRNNPDKWVRVDDFWAAMKKEHLWLQ